MFDGIYCPEKRETQKQVYCQVQSNRIIGLGGPAAYEYAQLLRGTGKFRDITLYENDIQVFLYQTEELVRRRGNYTIKYGDVLNELNHNAFYDLDFYGSVLSIRHHLPEIFKIDQFALTVSTRPAGVNETLNILLAYNNYVWFKTYTDKVTMLTILKTKQS